MNEEAPYTRDEVLRFSHEPAQRGVLCPKCNAHIPQFADLKESDRGRILNLITQQRPTMAMQELRAATGCSIPWAKLWVTHRGRPEWDPEQTAPCPYCGQTLRTPVAKQCRHCRMDWHDVENPIRMVAKRDEKA